MHKSVPALIMAGVAAATAGNAWAATHTPTFNTDAKAKAKAKKYKGPIVDMRWGPVQATISVKSKKITSVSISVSPENRRSQFIDDQAVPMLKQETLQAQTLSGVSPISGATMTSEAYIQSLQTAMQKAKLPGANQ
jgi:uncharacterized protein with FMN-binding domain